MKDINILNQKREHSELTKIQTKVQREYADFLNLWSDDRIEDRLKDFHLFFENKSTKIVDFCCEQINRYIIYNLTKNKFDCLNKEYEDIFEIQSKEVICKRNLSGYFTEDKDDWNDTIIPILILGDVYQRYKNEGPIGLKEIHQIKELINKTFTSFLFVNLEELSFKHYYSLTNNNSSILNFTLGSVPVQFPWSWLPNSLISDWVEILKEISDTYGKDSFIDDEKFDDLINSVSGDIINNEYNFPTVHYQFEMELLIFSKALWDAYRGRYVPYYLIGFAQQVYYLISG